MFIEDKQSELSGSSDGSREDRDKGGQSGRSIELANAKNGQECQKILGTHQLL